MSIYAEKDGEPGEFVTCSSCHGWDANETGRYCITCDGEGVTWEPLRDSGYDHETQGPSDG